MSSIFQKVIEVQTRFQEELLERQNVVGVAVGIRPESNEPAVVALVQQKLPVAALSARDMVPKEIDGVPTKVIEVGYLQALSTINPRQTFRPTIPGGVSIAHYKVTAGTLGSMVKDRTTGERLILSNNHVLANSNDAAKGDPILQPGPQDGGMNPASAVATLERFIELQYLEGPITQPTQPDPEPKPKPEPKPDPVNPGSGGSSGCDVVDVLVSLSNLLAGLTGSEKRVTSTTQTALAAQTATKTAQTARPTSATTAQSSSATNLVDAALARPNDPAMFDDNILQIGKVTGSTTPTLGMNVRKFGRTTGYTEGMITLLNATVSVNYVTSAGSRTARFTGQVICEPISQGGDSGSLVVDAASQNAVGLLFAGSPLATIFTPIDVVLSTLNVEF